MRSSLNFWIVVNNRRDLLLHSRRHALQACRLPTRLDLKVHLSKRVWKCVSGRPKELDWLISSSIDNSTRWVLISFSTDAFESYTPLLLTASLDDGQPTK